MRVLSLVLLLVSVKLGAAAEPEGERSEPVPMTKRAKIFRDNVKSFRLQFHYHGDEDKPFYRPVFSVPASDAKSDNPFRPLVQISEAQALKLIDQLARDGAFDNAEDIRAARRTPPPMPGYTLHIICDELTVCENLGWGKPLVARLDNLAAQLDGEPRTAMDFMLGRISFLRRE